MRCPVHVLAAVPCQENPGKQGLLFTKEYACLLEVGEDSRFLLESEMTIGHKALDKTLTLIPAPAFLSWIVNNGVGVQKLGITGIGKACLCLWAADDKRHETVQRNWKDSRDDKESKNRMGKKTEWTSQN